MDDRPLAATVIPAFFLAAALVGGWAFHGAQEASGRTSLYVVARRHADQLEQSRPQLQVLLDRVSVEGDVGRATMIVHHQGRVVTVVDARWSHLPDGSWEGPLALEPRDAPSPLRQR